MLLEVLSFLGIFMVVPILGLGLVEQTSTILYIRIALLAVQVGCVLSLFILR